MPVVDPFDEMPASGPPVVDPFDEPPIDYSKVGEFNAKKATEGQQWRLALGYLTTPDEKARADIIRKVLPGAVITQDPNNGRLVVSYKGEVGYIDKPGVTLSGIFDSIAQVAKFLPAGRFASGGGNLLSQIGRAVFGGATTSVAEDVAAIPQGSEQGVSPERAAITGIASGTGQALSPLVSRGAGWLTEKGAQVWKALRGTPNAVAPDGTLTDIGRNLAARAGLNPDEITPHLAQQLETAARQATSAALPEEQVPGAIQRQALGQRFRVPLTRGEITQDYRQQSLEENLRRMDVTTKAGQIMRSFEDDAARALRGESGESGFGMLAREVGGGARQAVDVSDAGQQIIGATQAKAAAQQSAYRAAYRSARESGAALDARNYRAFLEGTESLLKETVDYDPNLYPQTAKVLDNLRKRLVFMEEKGRSAPRKIPLAKLENIRKIINAQWKSADATDRMGLDILRNQFDEMVNGALDSGRVVGDPTAVQAWKQGRDLYKRFQQLYSPAGRDGGQAENAAGRIVSNWLKSDNITGEEVIRQAVNNKALTNRLLVIHGKDSPAHKALKQGALEFVFRPALKGEQISPRLIVSQYDRFFRGANKEQMQAIFSEQEIRAINEFVQLAKTKIPQRGVENFSNTGNVLVKAIQQLGQKLGLIGAATGNIEVAAAMGVANAISNRAGASQARSAVRGLVPAQRLSPSVVAVGAAGGEAIGSQNE